MYRVSTLKVRNPLATASGNSIIFHNFHSPFSQILIFYDFEATVAQTLCTYGNVCVDSPCRDGMLGTSLVYSCQEVFLLRLACHFLWNLCLP